jgi:4-methyl-5(b-hydroxyethyl)-thiazole monophosphate biosynthesis
MKVLIHFANGFEEVEAITPVDVLRRAGCEVVTVSVTGKTEVISRRGVAIRTDKLFEEMDYSSFDAIVLPGGQPGADNLNAHDGLRKMIRDFNSKGKLLAAICAAPLVLGNAGVLKGKKVTCFPGTESAQFGANYSGNLVEEDGNIITGKGPGAAMKFSLLLAEKLAGREKSEEIRKAMIVE